MRVYVCAINAKIQHRFEHNRMKYVILFSLFVVFHANRKEIKIIMKQMELDKIEGPIFDAQNRNAIDCEKCEEERRTAQRKIKCKLLFSPFFVER